MRARAGRGRTSHAWACAEHPHYLFPTLYPATRSSLKPLCSLCARGHSDKPTTNERATARVGVEAPKQAGGVCPHRRRTPLAPAADTLPSPPATGRCRSAHGEACARAGRWARPARWTAGACCMRCWRTRRTTCSCAWPATRPPRPPPLPTPGSWSARWRTSPCAATPWARPRAAPAPVLLDVIAPPRADQPRDGPDVPISTSVPAACARALMSSARLRGILSEVVGGPSRACPLPARHGSRDGGAVRARATECRAQAREHGPAPARV